MAAASKLLVPTDEDTVAVVPEYTPLVLAVFNIAPEARVKVPESPPSTAGAKAWVSKVPFTVSELAGSLPVPRAIAVVNWTTANAFTVKL